MIGLGLALVVCAGIFVIVGFLVVQARLSARHWRRVIADGDRAALAQLLDETFEGWRHARPPRGMAPADWRALHSAAVVAADHRRIRVSLIAEPDVQVVEGRRVEVAPALVVARRAAVRMIERLMYEIPHVSFEAAQVDVSTEFRSPDGSTSSACLLSSRVGREDAAYADWESQDRDAILAEWDTREAAHGGSVDPDADALISAGGPEAVEAAEDALRGQP